jgi:hypothetical protein
MEKAMGIGAMPLCNGACALRRRFSLIIRAFEGNRLVALACLFAKNVRIYPYPMTAADLCEWLNNASASAWE